MSICAWRINNREENLSLLEALALRVPTAPQAFLRQLCKKQRITVDGEIATAERCVLAGETIAVNGSLRWQECLQQSPVPPGEILFEDTQCMVINKPAGLAIHHAQGQDDNVLLRVQNYLRLRGETFQVAPIHRLDIGTSGAVLFGKGRASISQLGQMLMAGLATKCYLTLVGDKVTEPGTLSTDVPAKGKSKEALTLFRPVATKDQYTLLEVELVTGRRHQIRHQLAAAGRPIIGDRRYHGKAMKELDRPFLHCCRLTFPQPATGQTVDIRCPLPTDLQRLLETLGFELATLTEKEL